MSCLEVQKSLYRQNYVVVKISGTAGTHRNRKDGFARGAFRTRINSYFCPTPSVLAPAREHACSIFEHLRRLTKTRRVAFKHSAWWLGKKYLQENQKKLSYHCCIKLLYSAYCFLANYALGSPHSRAHTNAKDNRKACCYWANWEHRSTFPGRTAAGDLSFPPWVFRAQIALATCLSSSQNWTSWKYEALLCCW